MLRVAILVAVLLSLVSFSCADDNVKPADKPVAATEAASKFTLPPGFKATLFAGEPDVVQPIAFTFDDRGRLWVVECLSYPNWDGDRKDRVVIFEDTNGDGQHDKRTVFLDNGRNLTGIELGFGGVWLTAVPELIFVPDADGDDKPDGPPVVKLDGWDLKAQHNVLNGIVWGPDGWLWGLNGILSNSSVGKPGTPDAERMKMNCGVWRYHPVSERVEAIAHGTTNPWGLDFDQYGEAFITNCVIKHAFHVVPGAHLERMFGQDVNPRTYRLIPSIADHIHWGGGHWTESRSGAAHDAPGGGHAHSGCMIYLGENWPKEYRGRLFTCNIHGNRVNQDRLEQHGSSYVAKHEKDLLVANDPWFRGIAVRYGPDGGVYVADWTDTGECHNYQVADRSNGRIYKVVYGKSTKPLANLAALSEAELLESLSSSNPWQASHARRLLQERQAAGKLSADFRASLVQAYDSTREELARLPLVFAMNALGAIDDSLRLKLFQDTSEHIVTAAIRGYDPLHASEDPRKLQVALCKATSSDSAKVRLALADLATRVPPLARILCMRLANQAENANDPYLPYLIWYAIEANVATLAETVEHDLPEIQIPLVRELYARRLTEPSEQNFAANLETLLKIIVAHPSQAELQRDIVRGVFASLDGRRDIKTPASWQEAFALLSRHDDEDVQDIAARLALIVSPDHAQKHLLSVVSDVKQPRNRRALAVTALTQAHCKALVPELKTLLADPALRVTALRALPSFAASNTPSWIFAKYQSFDSEAKREAIAALCARTDWAKALLEAVEANKIPKQDFTAYHLQQLALLKDQPILERTEKLFGSVRPTKDDRLQQIVTWKQKLSDGASPNADLKHGRTVFNKTCANCHKLFDAGGTIGPELTGAQRNNLDYVLSNVLDPSAVVPRDYQMQVLELKDGRVLVGIIKIETDAVVTVQTSTALVKIAKADIEQRTATPQSMMPEGLIQQLSEGEIRDLVAYLASPEQVTAE